MSRMKRVRLVVAFPFVLGIFIGTLMTSFLMLAVRSIDEEPFQEATSENIFPDLPVEVRDEVDSLPEELKAAVITPSKLVSYNVLTSGSGLNERGLAIHRTWGGEKEIQGSIEFYIYPRAGKKEMDYATGKKIPVTSLEVDQVRDTNGQQRGSLGAFKLWESVCDTKRDQYLWFVKIRDDTYLRRWKLAKVLASLNSSAPLFVGNAVFPYGKVREDLGLRDGETYCHEACYVLSFKTLEKLCPLLPSCQENTRSDNEDVEIARCIRMHLGINCTTADEMKALFYSADSFIEQEELQAGDYGYNVKVQNAIAVAPLTKPSHFYGIHHYYTTNLLDLISLNNTKLRARMIETTERGAQSDSLLRSSEHQSPPWTKLGVNPPYKPVSSSDDVPHFQLVDNSYVYAESKHKPLSSASKAEKENVAEVFKDIVKSQISHGYLSNASTTTLGIMLKRTDPLRGTDYFLEVGVKDKDGFASTRFLHGVHELLPAQVTSLNAADYKSTKVNFVVATPPVSRGFQRFIMSFENSFLARKPMEHVGMLVIMYSDGLFKAYDKDLFAVSTLITLYRNKYPEADLRLVTTKNKYSRIDMLKLASKELASYELLFLADIHIDYSLQFLERCRMNTVENKQVYFPAVFSPYNPSEFYKEKIMYPYATKFQLNEKRGSWMPNSYHLACVYNFDLMKVLNDRDTVDDAGKEREWNLVGEFIHQSNLHIFRSAEPGLVHLWQDSCSELESDSQEEALCLKL